MKKKTFHKSEIWTLEIGIRKDAVVQGKNSVVGAKYKVKKQVFNLCVIVRGSLQIQCAYILWTWRRRMPVPPKDMLWKDFRCMGSQGHFCMVSGSWRLRLKILPKAATNLLSCPWISRHSHTEEDLWRGDWKVISLQIFSLWYYCQRRMEIICK